MLKTAARILIVEDEFLLAMQLEDILADGGHAVLGTVPDRAALETFSGAVPGFSPEIALVDLNLRDGLTGPEIARSLSERFGARVIYVTANPGQIDTPAPTAIGVVQKPFTREAILAAVAYAQAGCPAAERPSGLEPVKGAS